jgi:streptogramin lyase
VVKIFGRTGGFALAGVLAAAAGSGVAVAIPAFASSPPTVSVLTLPSPAQGSVQAILPAPSGLDADSLLIAPVSGTAGSSFVQLSASGGLTSQSVNGQAIYDNVLSSPVIVNDGSIDYLDDSHNLLALTATSSAVTSATVTATFINPRGIAVGPDGRVFITDNGAEILGCSVGSSPSCLSYAVPNGFAAGRPDGITSAGGTLWFNDDDGDLGSMSTSGTFSSVYDAGDFSSLPSDIVSTGANLWLAAPLSSPDAIDEVSTSSPATITHYAVSGPVTPEITSLTVGPDGNIWFADSANESVGFLNTTTHAVTEYPVPTGYQIAGHIASGPAGTGTLVVPLDTSGGSVVNLLGQITSPDYVPATTTTTTTTTSTPTTSSTPVSNPTATLELAATAAVSSKRVAAVELSCTGGSGATCAGKLTLSVKVKTKVKKKVKGKLRTITKTKTVTLASGRYSITSGESEKLSLGLSASSEKLLQAAKGHKLKVTAIAEATSGATLTGSLTLAGSKPKAKRK